MMRDGVRPETISVSQKNPVLNSNVLNKRVIQKFGGVLVYDFTTVRTVPACPGSTPGRRGPGWRCGTGCPGARTA